MFTKINLAGDAEEIQAQEKQVRAISEFLNSRVIAQLVSLILLSHHLDIGDGQFPYQHSH